MFERFAREARGVVEQAEEEARAAGSRTVEAEHLLLALAAGSSPVAGLLAEHGLDHEDLVALLEREEQQALAAVGVSADAYGAPEPVRAQGRVRFGTSAKRTLERTLQTAAATGHKKLRTEHLLLALLSANHGTVPRTLRLARVDLTALHRDLRARLA